MGVGGDIADITSDMTIASLSKMQKLSRVSKQQNVEIYANIKSKLALGDGATIENIFTKVHAKYEQKLKQLFSVNPIYLL